MEKGANELDAFLRLPFCEIFNFTARKLRKYYHFISIGNRSSLQNLLLSLLFAGSYTITVTEKTISGIVKAISIKGTRFCYSSGRF